MHSRLTAHLIICAALIIGFSRRSAGATSTAAELAEHPTPGRYAFKARRNAALAFKRHCRHWQRRAATKRRMLTIHYERLRSLDKEIGPLNSEITNIRAKQERAERFDPNSLGSTGSSGR